MSSVPLAVDDNVIPPFDSEVQVHKASRSCSVQCTTSSGDYDCARPGCPSRRPMSRSRDRRRHHLAGAVASHAAGVTGHEVDRTGVDDGQR